MLEFGAGLKHTKAALIHTHTQADLMLIERYREEEDGAGVATTEFHSGKSI